jgi:replication factor C subunit 1
MDIRNFFGKKPGGPAKKKTEAPAAAAVEPKEDKSKVPPSRRKAGTTTTSRAATAPVAAAAKKASSPNKSPTKSPAKAKPSSVSSASPTNKRKEVSASDFFGSSNGGNGDSNGDKSESPKKKTRSSDQTLSSLVDKKSNDDSAVDLTIDDNDDNNDSDKDVAMETKPSPRSSPRRTTRQSTSTSNGSSPTKSPKKAEVDMEEEEEASSPSPRKKVKKAPSSILKASPVVKAASAKKAKPVKRDAPLTPSLTLAKFDTDTAVSECMEGYTFVFSGNMEQLSRDGASELVKILGARVTTAVSKKTDYLCVGDILEDGRPYTEGSKYKRAVQEGCIVVKGEEALYGLCKQYDDKARADRGLGPAPVASAAPPANQSLASAPMDTKPAPDVKPAPPAAAAAAATKAVNPYARGPVSNPYAKAAANPYAKKAAPVAAPVAAASASAVTSSSTNNRNNNSMLWVDKYKPASTSEILGNGEAVKKLTIWLKLWESRFNNSAAVGKAYSNPNGPWKAALLSGPPGIGTLYCDGGCACATILYVNWVHST